MQRRDFLLCATGAAIGLPVSGIASQALRMGYFDSYAPFSQRGLDGVMGGALIDCVELVGKSSQLSFEHFGFPWARAQTMVERGDLDGFCTVHTQARQVYAEFCATPLLSVTFGIFHRAEDLRPLSVRSLEDLRQFRQGSYRGSGYAKEFLEHDRIQYDNGEESILRRIALGNLDTYVEGEFVTALKIKELGLSKKVRFTPAPFLPRAEFRFGLRRSYPDAAGVLARMEAATQAARKSGALRAILTKYR